MKLAIVFFFLNWQELTRSIFGFLRKFRIRNTYFQLYLIFSRKNLVSTGLYTYSHHRMLLTKRHELYVQPPSYALNEAAWTIPTATIICFCYYTADVGLYLLVTGQFKVIIKKNLLCTRARIVCRLKRGL